MRWTIFTRDLSWIDGFMEPLAAFDGAVWLFYRSFLLLHFHCDRSTWIQKRNFICLGPMNIFFQLKSFLRLESGARYRIDGPMLTSDEWWHISAMWLLLWDVLEPPLMSLEIKGTGKLFKASCCRSLLCNLDEQSKRNHRWGPWRMREVTEEVAGYGHRDGTYIIVFV